MVDVAALAGVSTTSVSHVLNGTRPVSADLQRRVAEAIAATGYSPNAVARSLATSNSMVIGMVISFVSNPFFAPLVSAVEDAAERRGYTLLLSDSHEKVAKELTSIQLMVDRRVDGIIVAPVSSRSPQALDVLAKRGTPTVLIDRFIDCGFDDVGVNNIEPTADLVTHLSSLGHQRIGFLHGKSGLSTTEERLAGYRLGLKRSGLPYDRALVRSGGSSVDPAIRAAHGLFAGPDPPTAIVPANNAMAVGLLLGLRALGKRVPDDVAVAAFDDIPLASLVDPPLTVMAQPIEQMGATAARLLFKRIAGDDGPPSRIKLPATFLHRTSCGCQEPAAAAGSTPEEAAAAAQVPATSS